jgi:DNA-binding response OmpR family regulator
MSDAMPLAYVVDDEPAMLDIVTFALETQGFTTESFQSAETAWTALVRSRPDLIVLDVMLPGMSGIALCQKIKAKWEIPVILVTAKSEVSHRIAGLEAEADDYIAKPFHPRELALRAQRLVRRAKTEKVIVTSAGGLELDPANHDVIVNAERVPLTVNEFKILSALISRPNTILNFAQLLLLGWGESDRIGQREMIKAAIYRMRHKLDKASPGSSTVIESVRGAGYLLRTE